ncbi:MAG: GNAT family N-acetyltransferase [Ruminococcaceae bacterium]|nr:GNAT family N-acetyltransferase [Oscillospiraceae bacterium]
MIYRKYESKDITAIRDILEKDLGYNCNLDKLKIRVDEMIKRGNYQIFVACYDNKVVGFIGCVSYLAFELENEGMKIIALAVSKEYRRKGIGTELLKTAEYWAKENSIEVVLLNSGLQRADAHIFYESQGYFKKSYGFIKRI